MGFLTHIKALAPIKSVFYIRLLLVLITAAAGFALGGTTASVSAAGSPQFLWFGPPVDKDGSTAFLTNGWYHSSDRVSLDWDDGIDSNKIFDRAWGASNDPNGTVRAYGKVSYGTADYMGCDHTVWIDVFDMSGKWLLSVADVHAFQPQVKSLTYNFSYGLQWNPGIHVANMIPFRDSCPWVGAHVHQSFSMSGAEGKKVNSDRFPLYVGATAFPFKNDDRTNWTNQFWWSE